MSFLVIINTIIIVINDNCNDKNSVIIIIVPILVMLNADLWHLCVL